jgi:hypothetical protein
MTGAPGKGDSEVFACRSIAEYCGNYLKLMHDACVERGAMILGTGRNFPALALILLAASWASAYAAAESVRNPRDTLVYKDGDRVQGSMVSHTADMIVFHSDRFGELRVKTGEGVVIPGEKDPETERIVAAVIAPEEPGSAARAKATPREPSPRARAKAEASEAEVERATIWDRYSPGLLTARVRSFFGPWKGRFAFSTEIVSDSAERNYYSTEAKVNRKWERNEVQISSRYDFVETNDVPTTDILKASGTWRHEFTKTRFAHYRPSGEWNRANRRQGVPHKYVLLQQEFGAGFHLITTPTRKVRTGVSQNLFNLWNIAPTPDHNSRAAYSAFEEIELKLPWQMGVTQRGVWYPIEGRRDGWENRIELNKKLTETLSASLRHEVRRRNPDGGAQDYDRLKLLFGFDF